MGTNDSACTMENIRFISQSAVQPANLKKSTHKIELTPLDLSLLVVDYTNRGLLFHKPTQEQVKELGSNIIHHLKASLSLTLDIFAPFAGRLATIEHEDKTSSFFIDCNGAGAQFVHAVADGVTMSDIIDPVYVPSIVHSLFSMNGVYNCEGISKPLLAVQVTELVDGIFIGCSYNHGIADGTSFWHFVNTWSEISRNSGEIILQPRPVLGYWFLDGIDHPIQVPFSYHEAISSRPISPPLQERIFHFTKVKIAKLKAKANAEMGTTKISSLQAILAHIWRSIVRNRTSLDTDQEIYCKLLVNMRQRLQPPLPEQYFGNAVQFGGAKATVGELLEHGLGWAALQINKMVALQTDGEAKKKLESWAKNPVLPKLSATACNALIVASSPRFNVYANDFGWGKPVTVRGGAGNNSDGKIVVFPGVEEGSMDIQICLVPETLKAIENDADFMEAVSK